MSNDPDGLNGEHPSDGGSSWGTSAGLAAVLVLTGIHLLVDWSSDEHRLHVLVELSAMVIVVGLLVVQLRSQRSRVRALHEAAHRSALAAQTSAAEARAHREEAERWRQEAEQSLRSLGEALARQFERWQLTAAEREVALLLLKGLSLKEIAEARGTSERTVRDQARAVYRKAGLAGRSELSAFFLEDLLVP